MINLLPDICYYIIEMLDRKDQFSCRKVCKKFHYLVDNSHPSLQNGYTFEEEINRLRLARLIRNLMLSDVDISHSIFIKQLNDGLDYFGYVEDTNGSWMKTFDNFTNKSYWRKPTRRMTNDQN